MRRAAGGLRGEAGALGQLAAAGVVLPRVVKDRLGPAPPDCRSPLAQCPGVPGRGQLAPQDPLNRQLGQDEVGRDAGQVEQQRLDAEPALAGRGQLPVDDIQVAVVNVGAAAVDLQPGAAAPGIRLTRR
jgi:hypothetical protein